MIKHPESEQIFSKNEKFRRNHSKVFNFIIGKSLKATESFHCLTLASLLSIELKILRVEYS